MRVEAAGLSVDLPEGWEASIDSGDGVWQGLPSQPEPDPVPPVERPDGAVRRMVAQLANFPLPAQRGDYGDGAIETMRSGDVLIILMEFDPSSADEALFAAAGIPRSVRAAEFDTDALHVPRFGATGLQRFFRANGRPFMMYVVIGNHLDRADDVPQVNAVLASLELS